MADFTIPKEGTVCWRELLTPDVEKAKTFYKELVGWTLEPSKFMPTYTEIHVGGKAIGGMMQIDENFGPGWENIPSNWGTYIAVDNCDATCEKIKSEGGNIVMGPFDAGAVGRMAVCSDPTGAFFSIIQFAQPE